MRGEAEAPADMGERPETALPQAFQRRKSKVKKGEALWLMSFSDMSLILMSFFVLQLAYSTPNKRKYDDLSKALKHQEAKATVPAPKNLTQISRRVRRLIKTEGLEQVAEVSLVEGGLRVEFRDQTLFAPGSADPNPAYAKTVGLVLSAMAHDAGDYHFVFAGYTDDLPIRRGPYRSNWELSAARGIALLQSFKARGISEDRMSVQAYAQTHPKVPVQGLHGQALKRARAANRRVVIRLE